MSSIFFPDSNKLDTPVQLIGSPILCFDRPDRERLFLCAEDSSIRAYSTALKNGGFDDRAGRDWLAPGHGGLNQLIYQSFQWPPLPQSMALAETMIKANLNNTLNRKNK